MVYITEELVRKRSEHNECIIGTLEELSLHQEDVEKIEHLNNWCKELKILYLQANLISKIENLNKLKKLEYLNLAINNIEVIENLEGCESLTKLDLTLNFIGNLESVKSLAKNIFLSDLHLTGNPCCDFSGYRKYVIVNLQQITILDGKEILKSERIKAAQNYAELEKSVIKQQEEHSIFRSTQRKRATNGSNLTDEEFWKSTSEHSPETRIEIAKRSKKNKSSINISETKEAKSVRLFSKEGRPLNINQAKLKFKFSDEDPQQYLLDIAVYKYLDTNLIKIDLQPIFVNITIKNKIFQMVFPQEISIEKSVSQRSQTTGHLLLKMPLLNYKNISFNNATKKEAKKCAPETQSSKKPPNQRRYEYLEVEEKPKLDISNIVQLSNKFEDNDEVPPLEYG